MTQQEVDHLTRRVISLENKRAGDKAALEVLTEAVRVLNAARQVQIGINTKVLRRTEKKVQIGMKTDKPFNILDFFKR